MSEMVRTSPSFTSCSSPVGCQGQLATRNQRPVTLILSMFAILAFCLLLPGVPSVALPVIGGGDKPDGSSLVVLSPANHQAASPDLAIGPDGSINVIWVDRAPDAANRARLKPGEHTHKSYTNLYFARSTDGGRSFTPPLRVNDVEGTVWGFGTSKPRIAVGQSGIIHVFYSGNRWSASAPRQAVDAMYT